MWSLNNTRLSSLKIYSTTHYIEQVYKRGSDKLNYVFFDFFRPEPALVTLDMRVEKNGPDQFFDSYLNFTNIKIEKLSCYLKFFGRWIRAQLTMLIIVARGNLHTIIHTIAENTISIIIVKWILTNTILVVCPIHTICNYHHSCNNLRKTLPTFALIFQKN